MQLLIPYSFVATAGCAEAAAKLQLPALERLLQRMTLVASDETAESGLSTAHERELARLLQLPDEDGRIPWAAHALAKSGGDPGTQAWAWITPVHWDVGSDHIRMDDPAGLQLNQDESRALCDAMAPFFREDGIELHYHEATPQAWLASGEPLASIASASPDRVLGEDIAPWMPADGKLRRLQNEMQMLLYTHPVNDSRAARGLATVNSFWISGGGRLDPSSLPQPGPHPVVCDELRRPALAQDWSGWLQAWRGIDSKHCQALLDACDRGEPAQLSLCSPRRSMRFATRPLGWGERLRRQWQRPTAKTVITQL